MKHTPGSWNTNFGIRPPRIYAASSRETTICDMPRWADEHWEERAANAYLIAAAPDLLEALETILAWVPSGDGVEEGFAAIDKARGQS